ncbi:amidase [Xanthobacter sp. 91]|uniref:amidase n=1 Tax=Xanthobacter sp. 91 TaxID=1117244 RepID=UPI000497561D|nr:amidase [Xanthobacter sp. 91]
MSIVDTVGAFCAHGRVVRQTREEGPLAGLSFGLKDFFDLAGVPTGAGSPEWLATHPVPTRTAPAIERLLDAGARCVGKTHTDELAWSLNGENAHYGTPRNVAAPGRIPGGSSSGSAAAAAAGLVDFGIGSDTGGSVRLPASYCGVYGIRTTHGLIPLEGAVPLAPSYDTLGWLARDPAIFRKVGEVLIDAGPRKRPDRLLLARDLFDKAGSEVAAALAPAVAAIARHFGACEDVDVTQGAGADWLRVFQLVQASEIWSVHGDWVSRTKPAFGPGIRERFAAAPHVDPRDRAAAQERRQAIRVRMRELVAPGSVLLLPSAPGPAPLLNTPEAELNAFRGKALEMLCPAGHAGLPQVSLPVAKIAGCPIGLSILGPAGSDMQLLDLAEALSTVLPQDA